MIGIMGSYIEAELCTEVIQFMAFMEKLKILGQMRTGLLSFEGPAAHKKDIVQKHTNHTRFSLSCTDIRDLIYIKLGVSNPICRNRII